MASELLQIGCEQKIPVLAHGMAPNGPKPGETGLLLEAFEMFTQASSSLESVFGQLQEKVQRLTEELEAKNRELERSLREKQEAQNYLRTILERLPCGVLVLDEGGEVALCNPMASDVLRQSRSQSRRGEKAPQPLINAQLRIAFALSARSGAAEVEIPFKRGTRKKILATSGAPLADESGRRVGTLHILRDITEVKALQEKNKRVERLSAMGEMAAELAHEIRNPLGSIELFASLLAQECTGDCRRWADNIRVGTRSLNTIVSNMLHLAHPLSPLFSEVDMHDVIREIGRFCEPIASQRQVSLATDLQAGRSLLWADGELMKQMLLNLVFNALKAMPAQGLLQVRTRNIPLDPEQKFLNGLEIQVQDSGIGIPPEHLKRIFDPFFTTNKNGTGLGLSIVHQIITRHSGTVRVASTPDRGTTFTIVFNVLAQKE